MEYIYYISKYFTGLLPNDEAHPIFLVEARYTAFSATGESVFQPPRNSHLKMDDLGVSLSEDPKFFAGYPEVSRNV